MSPNEMRTYYKQQLRSVSTYLPTSKSHNRRSALHLATMVAAACVVCIHSCDIPTWQLKSSPNKIKNGKIIIFLLHSFITVKVSCVCRPLFIYVSRILVELSLKGFFHEVYSYSVFRTFL